jgi:copper oxidase (laccase) domain-containing protein
LQNFQEITFGLSTKIGMKRALPFYFNLSLTVGDNPDIVNENREAFFNKLGLKTEQIAIQKQIHSDIITKELLHSYRRDGKLSGRSLGIIAMKEI